MNLNAAALRLMAAKGLTLEDVAEIVAANEVRADNTAAERQRKCRAKKKGEDVSQRDVTRDPSPNEYISNPLPDSSPVISNEITPPSDFELKLDDEPPVQLREEHVIEAWNAVAEECGLATARLTPGRKRRLKPFIRDHTAEEIATALDAIRRSSFMRGQNDRGWRANFDFFSHPEKFNRLVEGTYGN